MVVWALVDFRLLLFQLPTLPTDQALRTAGADLEGRVPALRGELVVVQTDLRDAAGCMRRNFHGFRRLGNLTRPWSQECVLEALKTVGRFPLRPFPTAVRPGSAESLELGKISYACAERHEIPSYGFSRPYRSGPLPEAFGGLPPPPPGCAGSPSS